jgi:hypothetical protein
MQTVQPLFAPPPTGHYALSEFNCDAAVGKSNEIILKNPAGFMSFKFASDFLKRASQDQSSAFFVTFIDQKNNEETGLFWNVPITGSDGKNLSPDTRGGSHQEFIYGKGDFIKLANQKVDKYETAADGEMIFIFKLSAISISVQTILSSTNEFQKSSGLGLITAIKLGCLHGEYQFSGFE